MKGYTVNLAEEASLESNVVDLLKKATAKGKLDHIVHTAGDSLALKPITQCSMDDVKQAGMVRYFAAFMLGKHAPEYLKPGPTASLTLTTGSVSEKPQPNWYVYGDSRRLPKTNTGPGPWSMDTRRDCRV